MQVKRSIVDDYILEALEKVICIVSKEAGYEAVQPQSLELFSNILGAYIDNMLTTAHRQAELGNRARPNIHDITRSAQKAGTDLSIFKHYLQTKLNDTPTLKRTKKFFKALKQESTVENVPEFLPSDNENSDNEDESTREDGEEGSLPAYVPRHFPPFPSKHSFQQTPIYIDRPDDPQKVRELNSEQSRTVEENLKKLMSAENQLLRRQQKSNPNAMIIDNDYAEHSAIQYEEEKDVSIPLVNYETFMQRRKRQKQSGTTLNVVERTALPATTITKSSSEGIDTVMEERDSRNGANATLLDNINSNSSSSKVLPIESTQSPSKN
ncbi:hypothetical protein BDF20DRAFT_897733 [Mycotypha africana]|uniref:uncharacterized protein n=1 Tax=Mycotypha africana TaxID=64632 RepID=UPI002300D7EA|nr:uncharacterized protein BDF20DRAFT_897733 [Mycotypha africana]KAI8967902.1 hypothetical protein BDF20DRAFT_897733 [Mycotypha africana]